MPDSPQTTANSLLKLTIKANGQSLSGDLQPMSVVVDKEINRIPYAKLTLLDGNMPEKDFPASNKDEFKPGASVEISAGYDSEETVIFKGTVFRHGIMVTDDNFGRLIVECRDDAVKMTIGRKNANYVDQKDSDIFSTLIGNYNGLSSDVEATTVTHRELVQYYCTDWDFMLSRAEANGLVVIADDGKLTVKAPDVSTAAELVVTYGLDLIEFQADMDARTQLASVSGTSWDMKTQAVVTEKVSPRTLNDQGNLTTAQLAEVGGVDTFQLQTATPLDKSALKKWAESCQLKSQLARIRGIMKFQGNPKAKPGKLIDVAGVGDRFSGSVYVSGVQHRIADGNWSTSVRFGLSPNWFAERRDLVAPPAAGLLPGVDGLQVGIVTKLAEDPASEYRIQVKLPVLQAETEGVWARLAGNFASEGFGAVFLPDVGDEVVLGYFNSDPSHPVILGSLYSSKRKPPVEFAAENKSKQILTKSKLLVEFDEEKKSISLQTPGKNTVVISDDAKSIEMKDQNGNSVTLNGDGITLDCAKDVKISSKGKITLDATGELSLSSKADVKVKGMNVNAEASVGFVAKGSASAEVSASGQMTVKGAMVMIN
ncbi:MAG: type VI secretion system tip protein VgrG [Deltaproteobacteria bacterium]|nr:type VI secretion system tip protein VgrG [Deltaproteobacteria bacterium]